MIVFAILHVPTSALTIITTGLAAGLGFAMKDTINNLFYGIQLMAGRIRVGDKISCDGVRGIVQRVSYLTTQIEEEDAIVMGVESIPLYFLNISGCGFDVEVLRQAVRFKKLGKGLLPYLMGILAALRLFKPLDIELTMNGKTEQRAVTIISVGNGQYFGGGMRAVPHAAIDDGQFDVVIADKVNRLAILRLLSKFIKGKHTDLPIAHEARCTALTIRCPGMTINMDGELRQMDVAEYRLLPGAAQIMK